MPRGCQGGSTSSITIAARPVRSLGSLNAALQQGLAGLAGVFAASFPAGGDVDRDRDDRNENDGPPRDLADEDEVAGEIAGIDQDDIRTEEVTGY